MSCTAHLRCPWNGFSHSILPQSVLSAIHTSVHSFPPFNRFTWTSLSTKNALTAHFFLHARCCSHEKWRPAFAKPFFLSLIEPNKMVTCFRWHRTWRLLKTRGCYEWNVLFFVCVKNNQPKINKKVAANNNPNVGSIGKLSTCFVSLVPPHRWRRRHCHSSIF